MSVRGIGPGKREMGDFGTPVPYTAMLIEGVFSLEGVEGPFIDPCCGDGNILEALALYYENTDIFGNELHAGRCRVALDTCGSFATIFPPSDLFQMDKAFFEQHGIRDIVTNPDFEIATEVIDWAERVLPDGGNLFLLLRTAYMHAKEPKRWDGFCAGGWFKGLYPIVRPSFRTKYSCKLCKHVEWEGPKHRGSRAHPKNGCRDQNKRLNKSTSDSADYSWFHWQKGHVSDGRWAGMHLDRTLEQ